MVHRTYAKLPGNWKSHIHIMSKFQKYIYTLNTFMEEFCEF